MSKNTIYAELAAKLGVPGSGRFIRILEASFTPEEAGICRELFNPVTCPELAARLGIGDAASIRLTTL